MSCPGDLYVVPGANPNTQNTIISNNQIDTLQLVISSISIGGANTLASTTIRTNQVSNIIILGNFMVANGSALPIDVLAFIEVNNVPISIFNRITVPTRGGAPNSGYSTCPLIASTVDSPPGEYTFYLKAFATTANLLTAVSAEIITIGNVIKTT